MKKTSSLLAVFVTTWSLASLVHGQEPTTPKTTKPQPVTTDTKTRSRRSGTSSPGSEPASTAPTTNSQAMPANTAEPKPAASTAQTASPTTQAETAKPSNAKPSNAKPSPAKAPAENSSAARAVDPLLSLRDEIEGAETPQERIRLQLKLVDELLDAGKKDDALNQLHQVIATDAFAPQDFYNAGNSLARLGDLDAAISAYRKAIEQRKGNYSRALNNAGVLLLRAGRWQESYEALTSALRVENFHYPEASYNLGRLYATRGETDLAVREWKRVLAQNPNHTAARDALAGLGHEGRVEVVSSTKVPPPPRNSEPSKPTPVFTARAAEKPAAIKSPSTQRAQVLTVDPTTYEFLQRARNSNERGKTVDAIQNYKKALSLQNGYLPPANLELSYLLINEKRFDEALPQLLMVANRDGAHYPISYFHLARLYEMRGDLKQAEEAFSQAAATYKPTNLQFLLDLSRVREKQGNFQGALEAIQQYVDQMKQQGQSVSWSEERLTQLRQKVNTPK